MRFSLRAGDTLTGNEVEKYLEFLRIGGAIKYFKTAREGLQSALVVATLWEGAELIGMGAIKARRPEYNAKIEERSGWPMNPHKREIGYIAIEQSSQGKGFSKQIVRKLLDFDDRVFGVTSNRAMMCTFKDFGFQREGHEWESKERDTLSLWIKWQ